MRGAILVQHHADHRTAGPFTPVGSMSGRGLDPAMTL